MKWSLKRLWPKFLTQEIAANIWKTKFADITQNVWKSKKGASVKSDFLCGGVFDQTRGNHVKTSTIPNCCDDSVESLIEAPLCDIVSDLHVSESLFHFGIKMLKLFQGLIIWDCYTSCFETFPSGSWPGFLRQMPHYNLFQCHKC